MLTLLFIPAISLRLALQRQRHLKQFVQTFSVTDTIWLFITVPVITHVILLTTIYLLGYEVKYDLILSVIYSNSDLKIDNQTIGLDVVYFLLYTLVSFCLSMAMCIGLVNNSRAGRQLAHLLGAGNEWYDLFNGKYITRQHDLILLDVAIGTKETTIIYSGCLDNYYFKAGSGELEYIVLSGAKKRDLRGVSFHTQDALTSAQTSFYSSETSKATRISGHLLMIPFREILNINVTYFSFNAMQLLQPPAPNLALPPTKFPQQPLQI